MVRGIDAGRAFLFHGRTSCISPDCSLSVSFCSLAGHARAETPEERAKKVTLTMTLNDVPAGAAAQFVEVLTKIKVHYQGYPGDQTVLSLNFENATADAALRYIAELAKLEVAYKADGVYFTPKK